MILAGKTVLITGGGTGIGRATAVMLAKCGADVALNYWTMPESAEVLEDGRLVLDTASGRRIEIADIDNVGGLRLRLSVSSGTLLCMR